MRIDIKDFETGWYGLTLHLKPEDIDRLVEFLMAARSDKAYHFHIYSTAMDKQSTGVADIEFIYQPENVADNADLGA